MLRTTPHDSKKHGISLEPIQRNSSYPDTPIQSKRRPHMDRGGPMLLAAPPFRYNMARYLLTATQAPLRQTCRPRPLPIPPRFRRGFTMCAIRLRSVLGLFAEKKKRGKSMEGGGSEAWKCLGRQSTCTGVVGVELGWPLGDITRDQTSATTLASPSLSLDRPSFPFPTSERISPRTRFARST
jgi:hypothetical protein